MKLFKQLLVAPAALSLLAPIAANADVSTLSNVENQLADVQAGMFSSTTVMSGSVNFVTGSTNDHATLGDELHSTYEIKYGLKSSFTGEDTLAVKFEQGNGKGMGLDAQSSTGSANNTPEITDLFYSFPLADDFSITVGPKLDGDEGLEGTASVYSDKAGVSLDYASLDGAGGAGATFGYKGDNGWNASLNLTSVDGADSSKGIFGDAGTNNTTAQLGYDGDNFGGAITYLSSDTNSSTTDFSALGVGAYYMPESIPVSISVYFDSKDPETGSVDDNWAVGVEGDAGPGTLGVGVGTISGTDGDKTKYETWYAYKVNDATTITPVLWQQEDQGLNGEDETGAAVVVGFKF